MIDYFITGVWKDKNGNITDVFLHKNGESGFEKGINRANEPVLSMRPID